MSTSIAIVIGMHRSGTSVVSRCLRVFGVSHGPDLWFNHMDNPRGHWEEKALIKLNEEILKSISMSWHSLSPIDSSVWSILLSGPFSITAKTLLLRSMSACKNYGCKEPRMTLLLPFWDQIFRELEASPRYIVCLRDPREVALSLQARDGLSLEKSYYLWARYMIDSMEYLVRNEIPFLLAPYSNMLNNTQALIKNISKFLGLPIVKAELKMFLEEFLDIGLRHYRESTLVADSARIAIPSIAQDAYDFLSKLARKAGSAIEPTEVTEFYSLASRMRDLDPLMSAYDLSQDQYINARAEINLLRAESQQVRIEVDQARSEAQQAWTEVNLLRAESQQVRIEVDQARSEAQQAWTEVDQARSEAQQAWTEVEQLRAQAEQSRALLSCMTNSKIWKATLPIRKILDFMKSQFRSG